MSKNKRKIQSRIKRLSTNKYRLSVKKSNVHIYAQIIDDQKGVTLVSSSSLKATFDTKTHAAKLVGEDLASKAKKKKISSIYLSRNCRYTGRLKNLCDSLRENGILF